MRLTATAPLVSGYARRSRPWTGSQDVDVLHDLIPLARRGPSPGRRRVARAKASAERGIEPRVYLAQLRAKHSAEVQAGHVASARRTREKVRELEFTLGVARGQTVDVSLGADRGW